MIMTIKVDKPKMITKFPGPKTQSYLELMKKLDWSGGAFRIISPIPILLDEGRGALLKDIDGNIYLDMESGLHAVSIGYCHPRLINAACEQIKKLPFNSMQPTLPKIKLEEELVNLAPGDFRKKVFLGSGGGTEALNVAARIVKLHKERSTFISFWGAYQGRTGEAAALSASFKKKKGSRPWAADVIRLPYPYCYRCPFGLEYPDCDIQCVSFIENMLETEKYGFYEPDTGETDIGAVFVEPILGSGKIVPPDEWLPRLRTICDKYGFLLVTDEVQTGLGRTGRWFASEHWGVAPDVMCLSKPLGGGIWPLSAVVAKSELFQGWSSSTWATTFNDNVLGCAIGLENIKILKEERLVERSAELGKYCLKIFQDMMDDHEIIGEVQGKGLCIGIELVKDRETKEPATTEAQDILLKMIEDGLLVFMHGPFNNRISFAPPLIITKEQIDIALEIMDDTMTKAEEKI